MITTIHQIEHLVHLSLLDKISKSDIVILGDDFQYKQSYYENRNKVRTKDGWTWVTVPVAGSTHLPMNEIKIDNTQPWRRKYLNTIKQSYSKAINFDKYYPKLERIISGDWDSLANLNWELLCWFLNEFNIKTRITFSSFYDIKSTGSQRLLDLCKEVWADTYLSGHSGKDYLDESIFKETGIEIKYHEYFQQAYQQVYSNFEYGMSALDYLMNIGNQLPSKGIESMFQIMELFPHRAKTLEAFGGNGTGHLQAYINPTHQNHYIWEMDRDNCTILCSKYPNAHIQCVDSLDEIKYTEEKYDVIIVDSPATLSIAPILNDLHRIVDKHAYIVIRLIKRSYNDNPNVDLTWVDENTVLPNLKTISYKLYDREAYFNEPWLYNCILEVEKI